jgi:hypothetical protein
MLIRTAVVAMMVLAALITLAVKETQPAAITFDDSASDRMVISAPDYRLTLSKANGAFLGIEDPRSGAEISQGSNGGCLWGSVFAGSAGYIGGCSYSVRGSNHFSYSWNAGTSTLVLRYAGDPQAAQHADATVTIAANASAFFDMLLTLDNHAGSPLRNAIFPSELLFKTAAVRGGYLPYYLPGVRVKPAFFSGDHSNVPTYPGGNAFADFLALDIAGTHFALYSVNGDPNLIQPVALGFIHNAANNVCQDQSFCTEHSFQTWVSNGGSWTSPTVRVVIGQDVSSTMLSYRRDNGIDIYPSLAAKLGAHFQQYAEAPLIKADVTTVGKPFRSWIPELSQLPSPSLLHPVAYMPGGHDHSYPDFLPPDPAWGSEKDFAAMVDAAHSKGLLVMPYTNPTWWTDDSRTVKHLPTATTVHDISVIDESQSPVHETYGANGGYDVSPNVPFVQKRVAQGMAQWQSSVPVDCIFEDQIGSRPWMLDFNPDSSTPTAYSQGWLEHTERYQQQCLMTENGWDRLAATEIGLSGSLLTWQRAFKDPDQFFGAGTWEAYPLALWLLHDKVLLYQHDLALETMTNKPGVVTWNMAFGMMLSYNWQGSGTSWRSNPWLDLITWSQRDVAALYAGQPLVAYTTLAPDVTQTSFPAVRVIANWNSKRPYMVNGTSIAPGGFLARSDSGSILAGEFSGRFNGHPLAHGTHYFIMEQAGSHVIVRQPLGSTTAVSIDLPGQLSELRLRVIAYDKQDRPIGKVSAAVRGGKVRFVYRKAIGRRSVASYRVTDVS